MDSGYIYVLSNPSFERDIIKVGYTQKSPEGRTEDLGKATGVPTPFVLEYSEFVHKCKLVEKLVHVSLSEYRVNDRREFFRCPAIDVIQVIRRIADEHRPADTKLQQNKGDDALGQECHLPMVVTRQNMSSDFGICNYSNCYEKAVGIAGAGVKYCSAHMNIWVRRALGERG